MESKQSWRTVYQDRMIDVEIEKNIILSDELEKIRLRLENKLRLFANEWFIHENEGINWLRRREANGQIGNLIQRFNVETQIRETVLADEAVEEIIELKTDFDNATGEYNFDIGILLKTGEILKF